MQEDNKPQGPNTEPNENVNERKERNQTTEKDVVEAREQASADIDTDPDFGITEDPGADLDEGEIARLDNDNDKNDMI